MLRRVRRATAEHVQEFGREPTAAEIGEVLDMHPADVEKAWRVGHRAISLDSPVSHESDSATIGDRIADTHTESPMEAMLGADSVTLAEQALARLKPREQKILRMRFGIGEKKDHTLEEIGAVFGLTRERIRQIQAQAMVKLQKRPV